MKIGILAALDNELQKLLSENESQVIEDVGYKVHYFTLYDKEIYVIKTGVGNISSSQTTQYLITKFNVDLIINYGVCGVLNSKLIKHKVMLVKNVVHYDFDTSAIDHTLVGQYEGYDSFLVPVYNKLDKEFVSKYDLILVNDACGDKFIAGKEITSKLKNEFLCDICEMELAGINFTCIRNKVPLIALKAESDETEKSNYNSNIVVEKGSLLFNKVLEILKDL